MATTMVAVTTAYEQSALDEFALLRDQLPERLRIIVDHLAEEHVQLLRLCNGSACSSNNDEEEARE